MDVLGRSQTPPSFCLLADKQQAGKVWEVRESALGAVSHLPGEPPHWEGWEDAAVAPEKLGAYLRAFSKLAESHKYHDVLYGHFGDGCVHTRMSFDFQSSEGIQQFRNFMEEAADLVVSFGGSLSGEHGDGQSRAELLPKMFGPELIEAFRKFKALWDPAWKMNPGKLVNPNKLDADLRLGAHHRPWQPETHFKFPHDHGSLSQATLRCVGVGKCREYEGGVMCPSFRAAREEEHSTRGRAHLLWEMTKGEVVRGQWRDPHVKSSLDLCLACKGCKSDCPVGVDVATYKAEFLSHHYDGRLHPLSHYVFGHIDHWARIASHAPGLVNFFGQTRGFERIVKSTVGVSPLRRIPRFASQTFRGWFGRRRTKKSAGFPVALWPDTFNNYFHPETAIAAVEVLGSCGFEVRLPTASACCGRPLYDFGMLDRTKRLLLQLFTILEKEIAEETPVVVLEPSCASVFRDELLNLFPADLRARRLASQVVLLSEFLEQNASRFSLPRLDRKALVHGHCHHKSIMKMTDEEAVLRRMGIRYEMPAPRMLRHGGSIWIREAKI